MQKKTTFKNSAILIGLLMAAGTLALSTGCEKKADDSVQSEKKGPTQLPASVETVKFVERQLKEELPGRVDAVRVAEVRARATGILLKREFTEGDFVKKDQVLFKIDPVELEATRMSAEAALASAKASLESAEIIFKRSSELVKVGGVSKQEYDNARIAVDVAKASVLGCEAALKNAEVALGYATVVSPIDGIIGEAFETEGALVSAASATKLALVQQMDPIYFDFSQSGKKQLEFRKAVKEGRVEKINGNIKVSLILEDGSEYPHAGTLKFSDVSVDKTTGMFKLRAEFPNPDHTLLPGMFARAVLVQGIDKEAILVPQKAVTRGTAGKASVFVLDKDRLVSVRSIQAAEMDGQNWVVTDGLKPGDQIVLDTLTQIGMLLPTGPVRILSPEEMKKMADANKNAAPAETEKKQ